MIRELFYPHPGIPIKPTTYFYVGAVRGECLRYGAADSEKTGTRAIELAEEPHVPIKSSGEIS